MIHRPCVGAGYCLDRIYIGLDALCLHNPATGREHLGMPHVITPAPHAAVGAAVTSAISEPQAMPVLRRRQAAHQRQAQRHEQSHADDRMPPERSRPSPVSAPWAGHAHDELPPSQPKAKKVVVVGGGPGGLEAARVCAERQHEVVLFEAATELGGQVRLAQRATWRRDLGLVTDWLQGQVRRLAVDVRCNTLAGPSEIVGERPDVVIVATGGYPDLMSFDEDPAVASRVWSVWDVLAGSVPLTSGDRVLLFDDHGAYQGPSCAEHLAATHGMHVEMVTPDRHVAHGMGALNWPIFLRRLYAAGVVLTPDHRLTAVESTPCGEQLRVSLLNEYSLTTTERTVDALVVDHGTLPADDLYTELRPLSRNEGEVDLDALLAVPARAQRLIRNPEGNFDLFRVGDAVSSRNVHAALYESLRLCKDL